MAIFNLVTWPLQAIRFMYGWRVEKDRSASGDCDQPRRHDEECAPVSIDSALQISTVWACIRLIAETVATLPLHVYRRTGDGELEMAVDHRLFEILHDAPNADQTALEFWEGLVTSLCTWGNAYAEKKTSGKRLVSLEPLRADGINIRRDKSGRRKYEYTDDKGMRTFDEDEVFHVRGFGAGGDYGLSPIAYARLSLIGARATDYAARRVYSSGLKHEGILTMPQVMDPEQRAQARANILAPIIKGQSGILEAGMAWQALTMNPHDAQMLESRSFNIEEICRWFRVPPFMIGHTQKSTSWGTGLEQQQIGFLTFALEPYLERIEQAVRRSLVLPEERKTIFAEFKVEKLLRADTNARTQGYTRALGAGGHRPWMSVDEVRRLENLPPIGPERGGDDMTAPLSSRQPAEMPEQLAA